MPLPITEAWRFHDALLSPHSLRCTERTPSLEGTNAFEDALDSDLIAKCMQMGIVNHFPLGAGPDASPDALERLPGRPTR